MPKYRVLEKSYLPAPDGSSRIYEAGEEVEYDGWPSGNLEPMCDVGRAKQAQFLQSEVQRKAALFSTPSSVAFSPAEVASMAALISQYGGQPAQLVPADASDVAAKKKA